MWFFSFLLFIPVTLLYLGMTSVGAFCLYGGIMQIAAARRQANRIKTGALVSVILALIHLGVASYAYFGYLWLW